MCLPETGQKTRKEIEIKNNLGFMNGVPNNYEDRGRDEDVQRWERGLYEREVKLWRRRKNAHLKNYVRKSHYIKIYFPQICVKSIMTLVECSGIYILVCIHTHTGIYLYISICMCLWIQSCMWISHKCKYTTLHFC